MENTYCVLITCVFVDQIDLMDMSQNPDGDYTHIGLYTDHWTKFITLFPMMGCSAEHVAYGLASSVFPYYGPPQFLHSSDGKEFAEEVVRLSMQKWKGRLVAFCAGMGFGVHCVLGLSGVHNDTSIHMHTYLCIYTHTHMYTHAHPATNPPIHTYSHPFMHTPMYVRMHAHTHTYTT